MSLTVDQWLQASLQVRNGGLGLRPVSSLASSAFLASAAGTSELQDHILHRVSLVNDDSCLLMLTKEHSRWLTPIATNREHGTKVYLDSVCFLFYF